MKRLLLWFAFSLLSVASLFAQDITGMWQGALQVPNRTLRTVIKISKGDTGQLKTATRMGFRD